MAGLVPFSECVSSLTIESKVTCRLLHIIIISFLAAALDSPGVVLVEGFFVGLGVEALFRGERSLVLSSVHSGQNHSVSSSIESIRPRQERW